MRVLQLGFRWLFGCCFRVGVGGFGGGFVVHFGAEMGVVWWWLGAETGVVFGRKKVT